MMRDYNYLRGLWNNFCGSPPGDPVSDELYRHLSRHLAEEQRKDLLKLVDCQSAYTEEVSLESFVAGFRLAAGIAMELDRKWYSYEKEEERQICQVP